MSGKRTATTDLNHDNWDREDEHEEAGTFRRADPEELKSRPIKKALRRTLVETATSDKPSSAFQNLAATGDMNKTVNTGFSFLGNSTSSGSLGTQPFSTLNTGFSFLSKPIANPSNGSLGKQDTPQKPFAHQITTTKIAKPNDSDLPPELHSGPPTKISESGAPSVATAKVPGANSTSRSEKFLTEVKEINLAFLKWVTDELAKRPVSILTRCFKDYIDHVQKLFDEEKLLPLTVEQRLVLEKQEQVLNELTVSMPKPGLFAMQNKESSSQEETSSAADELADSAPNNADDGMANADEPPKPEFEEVEEEGAVFSKRVKVFVKDSEDKYQNHGIGMLFLKPVLESSKTQLIVRANTALGNILVNILVTADTPVAQCKDSNNVVIVCIPLPDAKPPPRPVLFKLKSREDADELVTALNECKQKKD